MFSGAATRIARGLKHLSFRSEELQRIIIPYKIFSLGVVITIGTLRYEEHKTYAEIITELSKRGIKISKGEVFNLCQTFESLIKGWHEERVNEIKEKLKEYVFLRMPGGSWKMITRNSGRK